VLASSQITHFQGASRQIFKICFKKQYKQAKKIKQNNPKPKRYQNLQQPSKLHSLVRIGLGSLAQGVGSAEIVTSCEIM